MRARFVARSLLVVSLSVVSFSVGACGGGGGGGGGGPPGPHGDGTFTPAVPATTNTVDPYPGLMRTGDFNGDGHLDLVTIAGSFSSDIEVLLGDGKGAFASIGTFPMSGIQAGAAGIAVGDFNGDGRPDVVASNYGVDSVSILLNLNNGTGGLGAAVTYPSIDGPSGIVAADVNGDGKLDAVVGSANGVQAVQVFAGDGFGGLAVGAPIPVGATANELIGGDLNGDGKLDLVLRDGVSIGVSLGVGLGLFGEATVEPVGVLFGIVTLANVAGSPALDIVTTNSGDGTISILVNDGAGAFDPAPLLSTGASPQGIVAGDFDGDGNVDLAVACATAGEVRTYDGHGDGTFGGETAYAVGAQPNSLVAADLNADGVLDLAVTNRVAASVSVLLGNVAP